MAVGDFTGKKPKDTYDSILHLEGNDPLTAGYDYLTDGYGNRTTIEVSNAGTRITSATLNGTTILGSPLDLSYGGLGVSLSDPNADRLFFWDDSAGSTAFLSLGPNLSITGTTIDAIGGGVTDHSLLSNLAADDHTQYHNDARALTWLGTRSTTDLTEGTNLYYTSVRFNTAFSAKTTSDLTEGTNLYYTNARADARIAAAAGVSIQNYDTTLSTLAALPTAADKLPYFTGVDTSALTDFTAFARTLLDDADAAAMRITLGVSAAASFATIAVSGQSDVVADSATDTLTLVAGTDIAITTNALTDTITISSTATGVTDHGALTGLADDDHAQYHNDSRADTWLATKTTTNLAEGANLYYTSGRFDTAFATKTTADLTELTNLYYTNTRADARIAAAVGVSVQAYDATLTALAAYNTNGLLVQTAADTFTGRTITGTANQITLTNGDGVAGNPTVSIPYNLNLGSSSTAQSSITFFEDTDNGSNKITLTTPASIAADYTFTLPPDVGTSDYVLRTDGSGTTTWVAQSGGSTNLGLTSIVATGLISA